MLGADAAVAAGAAADAPVAADAALILFSSEILRDSSAMRAAFSLDCLSCASFSSAPLGLLMAPLDRVSLSGAACAGRLSSTWVCTLPLALRLCVATSAEGADAASLRRKSLKSRLWAATI